MPSPTLHLLDWSRPLLHTAVPHLAAGWHGEGPLDLRDRLIVVPTRRAGRRLREALAAHAATRGQAVFPPRVVLPEQILDDAHPPAGTATTAAMLVAWICVLRSIEPGEFDAVFPVEPADQGFAWAARLGRQLLKLQDELVENGLRIADVATRAEPFPEMRRWHQLAELERRFEARLAAQDLTSLHAARFAAAEIAPPPDGIRRVTLVAVADPMPLVLRRLDALAGSVPVEVLVHGPALELFDRWGRPVAEAWVRRALDLTPFAEHVHACSDPAAQAEQIASMAKAYSPGLSGADAMLGVAIADSEILPPLHHELERAGIASYDPDGRPFRQGELHRLLEVLLALVEEPSFSQAGVFLRCPAVLDWLASSQGEGFSAAAFLEAVDAIRVGHVPSSIAEARAHAQAHRPRGDEAPWLPVAGALDALEALVARAAGPFPESVLGALSEIYSGRRLEVGQPADSLDIAAAENWSEIARSTAEAAGRIGRFSSVDVWRLALQLFGETQHFPEKPAHALELQGWLELPWEDAPHLVVAGLNEGRVPSAIVGDAFLPESLRERLGLRTNTTRLARDAYLLHALVASRSRQGRLDLLLGRTAASGEPLRPSRLLLSCDDTELPGRVDFLFRDLPAKPESSALAWRRAWRLAPPAPEMLDEVSVTAFRDHLTCPFRFYLKQKLRMRPVDAQKEELDALDFGNIVHHALEGLHREPAMQGCTDAEKVRALLLDRFDRRTRALYGRQLPVPLLVQLESARQRLTHAARVHAADAAAGWVIHAVEKDFRCLVGGISVKGRIDRIDRHEPSGAIRVLDYKTYDQVKTPRSTHTRKPRTRAGEAEPPGYARFTAPDGEDLVWTDLQLPLYRRALAPEFGHAITLGYFVLPKAATDTVISLWEDFDDTWQAAADRCADGVAAAIRDGIFWPPSERLDNADDFEPLFHEGAAASVLWSSNPRCAP